MTFERIGYKGSNIQRCYRLDKPQLLKHAI